MNKVQGRRYYVNYDNLTEKKVDFFIRNFERLYRDLKKNMELIVYTSLPTNKSSSGEKKLYLTNIRKSKDGWEEPFDIGNARIIFETDNDDENLERYYKGSSYSGKYCIQMKISPTYTPFYMIYAEKRVYRDLDYSQQPGGDYEYIGPDFFGFKVKNRVYTVAREQDWGDLYRNETNPTIFERILYFINDLLK